MKTRKQRKLKSKSKPAPKSKSISVKRIIATLALALTLAAGTQLSGINKSKSSSKPNSITITQTQTKKVERIIDGDTIVLTGEIHLRYVGMSAPETKESYHDEATELNRKLAEGKRVRLEFDKYTTDRFGRELAYVFVKPDSKIHILTAPNQKGEINVPIELVRQGLAKVEVYEKRAKLIYQDQLHEAEQKAKKERRGIWKK